MTANYEDTVPPLMVHLVKDETKEKRPVELRTAHHTIILNLAQPFAQIAGYDPARKEVYLNSVTNPIVLCGSTSEANDANNISVTPIIAPNGRILTPNVDYCIPGQDEMWIACSTFPTMVGITVVRVI